MTTQAMRGAIPSRAHCALGFLVMMIGVGGCAVPSAPVPVAADEAHRDREGSSDGSNSPGQLVLERERFTYPRHGRRDPFQPRLGVAADGDAVPGLQVLGIIHHEIPSYSVVVLRTGAEPVGGSGTVGPGPVEPSIHRLRTGDTLGPLRIVRVRRRQVVVDVIDQGVVTRRTLEVPRPTGRR